MSLIEFQHVSFAYDQELILRELSISVEPNSFWAIAGPNGAGKSTFLSLLTGQLKPQSGSVMIEQLPVTQYGAQQLAARLALVQQEFVPAFGFSVAETVMMARFHRQKGVLFESSQDRLAVQAAMEATDTLRFADRSLDQLSGGERQRVFIARALAQQTPVLLLDEPTSHLDLKHQVRIFDLLKQMQIEQGKTILLVTHDINLASQYCDRVLLLADGGSLLREARKRSLIPVKLNPYLVLKDTREGFKRRNSLSRWDVFPRILLEKPPKFIEIK